MGDAMAHMQISTETSIWLLQAKDFLVEARRLKPGPARNELRQVAKLRSVRRNPGPHRTLIGRRESDRGGRIRYFLSGEAALISAPSSPASLEGTMGLSWNGATASRGADNSWRLMRSAALAAFRYFF